MLFHVGEAGLTRKATVIRNTQVKNDPDYLLAFLEDQGNEKKKL